MQKFGTGQVLTDEGEPLRRTAAQQPLTDEDVQAIEDEGEE